MLLMSDPTPLPVRVVNGGPTWLDYFVAATTTVTAFAAVILAGVAILRTEALAWRARQEQGALSRRTRQEQLVDQLASELRLAIDRVEAIHQQIELPKEVQVISSDLSAEAAALGADLYVLMPRASAVDG
jgi:hypothetical protein